MTTTRTFLTLGPGGLSLESEPTTEAEWREQFEGVRWLRDGFAFSSSDIHFLLEECGLRGEIKRIAPGHTRIYVPAGSALLCLSLQGWLAEQMPADALIDVVQEVAPMGETMPPATFAGVPFPYGGRVHVGVDTAKSDDESTGAWIIHHPSRGGPSSGLREVMMASEIYGRRAAPVLGLSWDVMPSLANAGNLVRSKHKRPGQWTDRTRARRHKRLEKAQIRRQSERLCRLGGLKENRRRGWNLCGPALTRFTEEAMRYYGLPHHTELDHLPKV